MRYFISLFLIIVTIPFASGQGRLDTYLQERLAEGAIPGFSVVVVKGDQIVYEKGFGVEKIGSSKPMTAQTSTAIGSLTKSFTAMAVLQLVERGLVDLDAPVVRYLPEFRTANKSRSDQITVRMLLNNTSGLQAAIARQIEPSAISMERLLQALQSTYLTRVPGKTYEYSNTGFAVAGLLVSRVSGLSYEAYLRKHIFEPLQMQRSTTDPERFLELDVLYGHYLGLERGIPARPAPYPTEMMAAGSLLRSSAHDLGHYLIALLNGGQFEGRQLLSPESVELLWQPNVDFPGLPEADGGHGQDYQYGLGWMLSQIDGRAVIHHGGSRGSMSSFTMIDRERRLAASVLANVDHTFFDKYRYTNLLTMVNNVLHLTADESASAYGIPTIADPTLNSYQLPKPLQERYLGEYAFSKGGDNWLFYGVRMEISRNSTGELEAKLVRGAETVLHFRLDFVNEAQAISRHLGTPQPLRFVINPAGQVTGAFFNSMEFWKVNATQAIQSVILPEGVQFGLPSGWKVKQQAPQFLAKKGDWHLRAVAKNQQNVTAQLKTVFPNKPILRQGLPTTETHGQTVWHAQSFVMDGDYHFTLWNEQMLFILTAPPENLSEAMREVAGILQRSFAVE